MAANLRRDGRSTNGLPLVIRNLGLLVLAVTGIAPRAEALAVTVPPGLAPGTQYRLVFVTYDYTDAESTNISDYNTFVTTEADLNPALADLGATWAAIASTDSVGAATNIGVSTSGIYTLDGSEVADGTAALFSTGLSNTPATNLLGPIDINQYGNTWDNIAWTGSLVNGQSSAGYTLGDSTPVYGYSSYYWSPYLSYGYGGSSADNATLYAISSVLTVPGGVPEPGTVGFTALGVAMLLLAWRRRRAAQP